MPIFCLCEASNKRTGLIVWYSQRGLKNSDYDIQAEIPTNWQRSEERKQPGLGINVGCRDKRGIYTSLFTSPHPPPSSLVDMKHIVLGRGATKSLFPQRAEIPGITARPGQVKAPRCWLLRKVCTLSGGARGGRAKYTLQWALVQSSGKEINKVFSAPCGRFYVQAGVHLFS